MPECIVCGGYSKFENGKCFSCYKGSRNDLDVLVEETEKGLSNRDWNYRYNMIKGRIAETLVQELFLSLTITFFVTGWKTQFQG